MCQRSIQQLCSSAHPLDITNSLAEQRVFTAKHLLCFANFFFSFRKICFFFLISSFCGVFGAELGPWSPHALLTHPNCAGVLMLFGVGQDGGAGIWSSGAERRSREDAVQEYVLLCLQF